ncbi:MAG: dihydrodipicolinate reductase [Planctomycetes bacterium]|nr:dihydrodipicolinate reductase [Planctomycetota bacterium]MCC7396888.1 dihydrodipicolinate reductase [Planctomycetota bacterium]
MTTALRVVSFGLGPIGLAAARLALQKRSIQLVGAIDIDPGKIGRDLGDLLELDDRTGIVVEGDAEAALRRSQPDVLLHCTSSHLPAVLDQLLLAAREGVDVVSATEELSWPAPQHAELAASIDAAARAAGTTVLGTGANPGYAMDFMVAIASAVTFDVQGVKCVRVVDAATRRLPLLKKVGAGLGKAEFLQQLAAGRCGHVGMRESVALVGHGLGFALDQIELTVEAVIAAEDLKTPFLVVKEGQVAGLRCHGHGLVAKRSVIHLDLAMYVGAPDPRDEITLDGTPPVQLRFSGGIPGDQATAAILVNSLHSVAAARAGLCSVLDVAPPRLCR